MALPDTRTKILDAAEHLFAEHGYRGTSVRAITDLAGANLAAVGYHFGSKAELLGAVARRVIEPITAAQCAGLDALLARTPNPPVAELVEAFAGPLFDEMPAGRASGARTSRLIVTILSDPAEEARSWVGPDENTVGERYLAAFAHALPGLAPQELLFRMRGILAVTAIDRVEVFNQPAEASPAEPATETVMATATATAAAAASAMAGEEARRWAITFLTAAMSAPPTQARQ
ncbi:TetR/AcrR family transcriptional regulator [Streptomyces sp. NPDC057654]|uniref:TetR/AcrR family transcriptional regulator n=1 Tax=Streptomyces sp. NPDC057654 TaxID=3346196 RepID=UPI003685649B